MSNAGASIEAVLTLNATGFTNGVKASLDALDKFERSISAFSKNTTNMVTALQSMDRVLTEAVDSLTHFNNIVGDLSRFQKFATSINKIANALRILSSSEIDAVESMNLINNMFYAFQGSLNGIEVKVKGVSTVIKELSTVEKQDAVDTEQVATATQQYAHALEIALPPMRQMIIQATGVGNALNNVEKEELETATATNKATQSMNRQSTATNRLGKAMSSLRMIGTMVASMMVWNFASSLVNATRETVNAKSEMEGYFKMLHFSTGQVNNFNKALDETVKKFPRLNKYALGETISSIGVEFELTTKEMEKAMPVVSMITSEYLRAGRNVNEASLAVKDILQGEFQRLSRETGVKGDQLKEAGWSGDKTDVMGLLEALDKVGKERNWDKFVAKANSLNDAVLILQNRFSEWSADMVGEVQPSIVNAFNMIMDVAGVFAQMFSGIWKSLNSNSIFGIVAKIGLISTALIHGLKYITMYRSGANLLQASTMGLKKAITSLVFGVNLETSATMKNYEAILLKILGIKAEDMAEGNLVKTINKSILRKGAETTQENLNTASKELNAGATATQSANNIGFVAGLQAVITGKVLDTEATLTLSGAMGILTATMLASPFTWFVAGLMAIAGAFYVLTGGMDEHWAKMQQFNEMVEDSDSVIQQNKDYLEQLGNTLGTDSKIYQDTAEVVDGFNNKLSESKEIVKKYKNEVSAIDIKLTTSFEGNLKNYGLSDDKIAKFREYGVLDEGEKTYNRALDVIYKQEADAEQTQKDILGKMDQRNAKDDEIMDKNNQIKEHEANLIKHSAEHNASEDWWSGTWAGFLAGVDSLQLWLDYATEDLASWWNDFNEEWGKLIPDFNKTFEDIQFPDIGKMVTDWINDAGISLSDTWDSLTEMWDNNIVKPIMEFDWVGNATEMFSIAFSQITHIDVIGMLLDALLPEGASASDGSSDHPSFMEDVSNIIGFNIQGWIDSFNADPMGTLGIELPKIDILGLIQGLLPSGDDSGGGGGFNLGQWLSDLFNIDGVVSYFTTNLSGIISSVTSTASTVGSLFSGLKSTIQGHLTNIVTNVSTGFENAKSYATSKITAMRDSVSGVITQMIDAWKKMKDSILDSAKLIYDGVKSKFDSVKKTLSDFFTKLQNPSQWGSAGQRSWSRQPKPQTARRLFSGVSSSGKHGAGINPYTSPNKMVKLSDLVNAVGGNKEVSLSDFLSMFSEGGFGGWSFHEQSKTHIFNKGKEWKSGAPNIKGIGTVGEGYKVARFWNGKPSFSFDEFLTVAEAIFSAIPYKFYYDSDWKGNWVSALLSGALNCSDGADALLALASVFGFSGSKVHTNLKDGTGHFYTVINGKTMDTTNFQHNGSWGALGGAGRPSGASRQAPVSNREINIIIEGDVYGEEDFMSKIKNGAREVMREEFNDPFSGVM